MKDVSTHFVQGFADGILQNHLLSLFSKRNPAATFGEVSKHVAAMWDAMEPDSKAAYKRRTEQAKKEYLRQLASYRYHSYIT